MKIHFARHGESLANTLHIISNLDLPHPLTQAGCEQARSLATRLKELPPTHIYASPVLRARETAEIVGAQFGLPVQIDEGLKEYDCGILEGRGDEAAWALHQQFVQDWLAGKNRDLAPQHGETFFDIQARLGNFISRLMAQHNGTQAEILCVSHGGTLLFGLPGLLSNVDFSFVQNRRLGHTAIISAETCAGKLCCLQWDDVSFD